MIDHSVSALDLGPELGPEFGLEFFKFRSKLCESGCRNFKGQKRNISVVIFNLTFKGKIITPSKFPESSVSHFKTKNAFTHLPPPSFRAGSARACPAGAPEAFLPRCLTPPGICGAPAAAVPCVVPGPIGPHMHVHARRMIYELLS